MNAIWEAHEEHGKLSAAERNGLSKTVSAFPKQRKEPLVDAAHVREAPARFDQVKNVTDTERHQAFRKIQAAAKHYKVELPKSSWHKLGGK